MAGKSNRFPSRTKDEIYKGITDKFIESVESGNSPYHRPYALHVPISAATDKTYGGANNLILMSSALRNEFESDRWITGKAAVKLEYEIDPAHKKHGTEILLYKKVEKPVIDKNTGKPELDSEGKEKIRTWFLPRSYYVYNLSQFTNVPEEELVRRKRSNLDIDDVIQHIADDLGVNIVHGCKNPEYDMESNTVRMPSPEGFESESAYNVVLLQQLVHATGVQGRIGRIPDPSTIDDFEGTVFDSESMEYAKEKFIGSLGAIVVASLVEGLDEGTTQVFENQAAEVKEWVNMMKNDPGLFISATREAQKSANYLVQNIPELIHNPNEEKTNTAKVAAKAVV